VYVTAAMIASNPISRSHGFTTSDSTAPTTAATPKETTAALRTAAGDASPLATRRTGPRRFLSVPRTPSE
jgi:hypothetical protein